MKVGVKFCGNCNPQLDMVALKKWLELSAPEVTFVHWEDKGYEVLLLLSSCPVDCTSRPDFAGSMIQVTSELVDQSFFGRNELPGAVLKVIHRYAKVE
jgi:hypothetical protein